MKTKAIIYTLSAVIAVAGMCVIKLVGYLTNRLALAVLGM